MIHGVEGSKKKKPHILMEEKDYITEAWVQGGKAIGSAIKPKKKKK